MPRQRTLRVSVLLPVTTPQHLPACRSSLKSLLKLFPGGSTIFWSSATDLRDVSGGHPLAHGLWRNPATGRDEPDSHLLFTGHWDEPEGSTTAESALHDKLDALEHQMAEYYQYHSRKTHDTDVFQQLIFVEAWPAVRVALTEPEMKRRKASAGAVVAALIRQPRTR